MIWMVSGFFWGLEVPKDRDQSNPRNFRPVGMQTLQRWATSCCLSSLEVSLFPSKIANKNIQ